MTHYEKAVLIMDFLEDLGISVIDAARAVDDRRFDRICQILAENPDITKDEFLEILNTMEVPEIQEERK